MPLTIVSAIKSFKCSALRLSSSEVVAPRIRLIGYLEQVCLRKVHQGKGLLRWPLAVFGEGEWRDFRIGIAAGVGSDLPEPCRSWLESSAIDTDALMVTPLPTLRAWQVFEEDGRRTQVWRVPLVEGVWSMLRPAVSSLPPAYQKSRAYHAGVHPSGQDVDFIQGLKSTGAEVVSIEPYTRAETIVSRAELEALVSSAHIFSPNEEEAWSLVGPGTPMEVIGRLVELGGQVVCLRRGKDGAVVHRADTGETWEIPAFYAVFAADFPPPAAQGLAQLPSSSHKGGSGPNGAGSAGPGAAGAKSLPASISSTDGPMRGEQAADVGQQLGSRSAGLGDATAGDLVLKGVKDQTGCGNSFCGGFLAGWVTSKNLLTAGLWAAVAASFMIEYEGVPPPCTTRRQEAEIRLSMLRSHATCLG